MIKDGHIDRNQLIIILVISTAAKIFLTLPRVIAIEAENAGWLAVSLGAILTMVPLLILVVLLNRFPGKSIIQIGQTILGFLPGSLVGLAFISYFIILAAASIREFSESIATAFLPLTPLSIFVLVFLLLAAKGIYGGIETIARTSYVLAPFVIISILTIIIFLLPYVNWGNFLPILGPGLKQIIFSGVRATNYYGELIFLGVLASFLRTRKDILPAALVSLFFIALILILAVGLNTAIFGLVGSRRLSFPLLEMTRLIGLGAFFQRIESVFLFIWFFMAALKIISTLYVLVLGIAQILKINNFKPLVWPVGIIVFTISFFPTSLITAFSYDENILRVFGVLITHSLPVGLYLLAVILNKRGKPDEQQKVN